MLYGNCYTHEMDSFNNENVAYSRESRLRADSLSEYNVSIKSNDRCCCYVVNVKLE